MTAPALTLSAIGQALAIRREVMEAEWPPTREAEWAVGWKLGELDDLLTVRDRLLNDDLDPVDVRAPDMGVEWDLGKALAYVEDEALQCAKDLRKRLEDHQAREQARLDAEVLLAPQRMVQKIGGLI